MPYTLQLPAYSTLVSIDFSIVIPISILLKFTLEATNVRRVTHVIIVVACHHIPCLAAYDTFALLSLVFALVSVPVFVACADSSVIP